MPEILFTSNKLPSKLSVTENNEPNDPLTSNNVEPLAFTTNPVAGSVDAVTDPDAIKVGVPPSPPPLFKACDAVKAYELLIIASYMLPLASLYLGILSDVSLKYVLELIRVCPAEEVTYCWYGIPIEAVILFMFNARIILLLCYHMDLLYSL